MLRGSEMPLTMRLTQRFELEVTFRQLVSLGTDDNRTWGRKVFHTRGDVRGMTHRDIIGVQIIFMNRAHYDFAGVYTDAHQQRRMTFGAQRLAIAAHVVLHE